MDGPWDFSIDVVGEKGSAHIDNFVNVHQNDRLTLRTPGGEHVEHCGLRSTYHYQMDALAAAITEGRPFPTGAEDAVANMQMIDACYRASGLRPREGGTAPQPADDEQHGMAGRSR